MASTAASIKTQFDLHTRLFNNVLEGITDEESNTRNNDHVNHIKWIAGHMLNTRLDFLSRITGLEADTTFGAQFGRGTALDPEATYPGLSSIVERWNGVSGQISNNLATLPEEMLDAEAPVKTPVTDETNRGLLAFLVSHEAYHTGQLGLLRKMAGKEAMSYK